MAYVPSYLQLAELGLLEERAEKAHDMLDQCNLCPRNCGVDRRAGEVGACATGEFAIVYSAHPHYGEEPPLVGREGSGTVFFARCNMSCLFCQNAEISLHGEGRETPAEKLADLMLDLQAMGCNNINFVSPSHVAAQILDALVIAADRGLSIPIVYNTGGYDSLATLALLDGAVDIYMPDMKYSDDVVAEELSHISDYPSVNRAAVKEMHRQVGDLQVGEDGVATRGLIVRHLVLPGGLAGTEATVQFLADNISPNTYLNIMDQYLPNYYMHHEAALNRGITPWEFDEALSMARNAGLRRLNRSRSALRVY
jgi:putative pyruvate formate lyase activating enzyme